jgi:methylmalonyl-CoA mutase
MANINNKIRVVTAASLFDGHDAAINIMRRIIQAKGAEVIHLGHNRSAQEIVEAAIQEDADAIAVTSYQGGHIEFFKYMLDLLKQHHCQHIKIFGGGGGTILPKEMQELHAYGITRIYSPDDGRQLGLEGMIEDLLTKAADRNREVEISSMVCRTLSAKPESWRAIAKAISISEEGDFANISSIFSVENHANTSVVLGITGTGGAGKSSVTDEIVRRFLLNDSDKTVAVLSVDPSKKKTGGALLGDRIRMNSIFHPRAYMRSMATRDSDKALSNYVHQAIEICKMSGFDLIILESAGVGQSDASILEFCDVSLYVMTPEYGAASQLEKINMLDFADIIAINKFDKQGALDAFHDVVKQYKRNHHLFQAKNEDLPVVGTVASKFNDEGVNRLFDWIVKKIAEKKQVHWPKWSLATNAASITGTIIPASRTRYLSEIAETIKNYDHWVEEQCRIASQLYQLKGTIELIEGNCHDKHRS